MAAKSSARGREAPFFCLALKPAPASAVPPGLPCIPSHRP